MPDEFPTLEAVAALGVLALVIRTLLVANETKVLPPFAAELARNLRVGNRLAALAACNGPGAPALGRVARELVSHVGDPPYGLDAAVELRAEQNELEQDLARRGESGRARDLIVLAVLLGAMAFAALSGLQVGAWFQGLAGAAALLLVVGYVMRTRLRRVERVEFVRISDALAESLTQASGVESGRPSLHSIDGGCTACGESVFLVARGAALGAALPALGIHELRICKNCGLVSGLAADADALSRAALEELSVPVDLDSEASSDDTEHEG
jgi:hypothetical protein